MATQSERLFQGYSTVNQGAKHEIRLIPDGYTLAVVQEHHDEKFAVGEQVRILESAGQDRVAKVFRISLAADDYRCAGAVSAWLCVTSLEQNS